MNKTELINALGDKTGQMKIDVEAVLYALSDTVKAELKAGNDVTLPGLGKMSAQQRDARKGRNPQTGAEIDIPAKTVAKFKAAKELSDAIA